VQKEMNKP